VNIESTTLNQTDTRPRLYTDNTMATTRCRATAGRTTRCCCKLQD